MKGLHRKDHIISFIGDICVLITSLYITLTLRYSEIPSPETLELHLIPFSLIFTVSVLVNFIAGLYEKHTLFFQKKLPIRLLNVQIINTILGVIFFYFIPFFSIAPKTILFIYLIVSLVLMLVWRMFIIPWFSPKKDQLAVLIGDSVELEDLKNEIHHNSRYTISFIEHIKPDAHDMVSRIQDLVEKRGVVTIVIDTHDPRLSTTLPLLYPLALSGVLFLDAGNLYEMIFDRIALSNMEQGWFVENMSRTTPQLMYDGVKRLIDILVSGILGILSLIVYPFVYCAIKWDDKGVIFSYQDRIGHYNKNLRIMKFRTMSVANDGGKWGNGKNTVTRVGKFLRKTRIDELPQLWNVLRGDVSLIGPRPEFPEPVARYAEKIPYYNMRHIIKPGLSGWAQIYGEHPHHGVDIDMTANKLSYDLFYVKNRSLMLDIKIALRTIQVLFTFMGR